MMDVSSAASGNEKTNDDRLAEIFAENLPMLRGYVSRTLGNPADTDDVIQEVFVKVLRAGNISRWENSALPFLRCVALNYIRDKYRRGKSRKRNQHCSLEDCDLCSTEITPEVTLHWQQQLGELALAISELRPRCKQIFMMHRSQCKTYKQIGAEIGISHKTVENYIDEALKHCRAKVAVN